MTDFGWQLGTDMDPRVMLITTLVGLGVTTVQTVIDLWRRDGVDDATLAKVQTEADKRLAQWRAM